MKIGLIETGLPPHQIGGAELQAWNLAVQLQRKGHEVRIFTTLLSGTTPYEVKNGIHIFRAKILKKPFGIAGFFIAIIYFIWKQRAELDVLLCFRAWPNGFIGFLVQKVIGIPSCFSIRGGDWFAVIPKWWGKIIFRILFNGSVPVLVQSGNIAAIIETQYPDIQCQIIPNGIQLGEQVSERGDSIVYVGNLNPHKGVPILIDAVRNLSICPLKIIGDGSEREVLEKRSQGFDVQFFGRVLPERVSELTRKHAKLLVLPSLYSEGLPNALLEAMSLGIPVIATDVSGGVRDLLENGQAGLLVAPGDVGSLEKAIESVWHDEQLQQELAQAGLKATEKYSWPVVISMWEELFEKMLNKKIPEIEC
jgi:glycosyltransferase involved in cell wall biosynthesis